MEGRVPTGHWANFRLISGVRLFTIIGQLAYIKLYSNLLPLADLGIYFFLLTIFSAYMSLVYFPLDQYQQAHVYGYRREGISLRSFLPANLTVFALLAAGALLLLPIWFALGGGWHWELLFCLLLAQFTHIVNCVRNFLNNLEHKLVAALFFAAESIAKAAVLFALSLIGTITPLGVIGAAAIAMAFVALAILPAARHLAIFREGRFIPPQSSDILKFALPVSAAAVLAVGQLQGFRFMAPLGIAEMIGVYATVAGIGSTALIAVSPILIQMYQPEIFKSYGAFTPRYLLYALGLITAVAAGVAMFAVPMVRILTNESFVPYALVAVFGVGVEGGNLLLGGLFPFFNIRKRTGLIFVAGFVAFAVSALLMAILFFFHALTPVTIGLSLCTSQAVCVFVLYIFYRRMRGGLAHELP